MSHKIKGEILYRSSLSSGLYQPKTPYHRMKKTFCYPSFYSASPLTILSDSTNNITSTIRSKQSQTPFEPNASKGILTPLIFPSSSPSPTLSMSLSQPQIHKRKTCINFHNKTYKYDFFQKVFNDKDRVFRRRQGIIDNKLNILYAESESHFQNKMQYLNTKRWKEGKGLLGEATPNLKMLDKKLDHMKNKLSFMKCVTNYAYIDIETLKIKLTMQSMKKNMMNHSKSTPFYKELPEQEKRETLRRNIKHAEGNMPFIIHHYEI